MKHHKALTVYCHHADIKSLKHFFRKRRYKAVVIAQEFVERGTCLCAFEEPPRPHGRLIDADELKKNMRNYYPSIDHLCCSQHVVTKRDIDCAPTIIEAEVSE